MSKALDALKQSLRFLRWAAIPEPTTGEEALVKTVQALRIRSQIQSREAGDVLDSFITVQDLLELGVIDERGIKKVEEIEQRINDFGIP